MSWDRPFPQPVPLPKGPPAQTLRDAADFIRKLSQVERDCQEWRLAIQVLVDAAEDRGPTLIARMGIVSALEAHVERALDPAREEAHQGKLKTEHDASAQARMVIVGDAAKRL